MRTITTLCVYARTCWTSYACANAVPSCQHIMLKTYTVRNHVCTNTSHLLAIIHIIKRSMQTIFVYDYLCVHWTRLYECLSMLFNNHAFPTCVDERFVRRTATEVWLLPAEVALLLRCCADAAVRVCGYVFTFVLVLGTFCLSIIKRDLWPFDIILRCHWQWKCLVWFWIETYAFRVNIFSININTLCCRMAHVKLRGRVCKNTAHRSIRVRHASWHPHDENNPYAYTVLYVYTLNDVLGCIAC